MLRADAKGSWEHLDDPGEPQTGVRRLSVTDGEAEILARYVEGLSVLEIGTGLGVSTRALASTAERVTTVDIDPWVRETVWPTLPANVVTSIEVPLTQTFDATFIDADHSKAAVARDLVTALRVTRNLILVHDTKYGNVQAGLNAVCDSDVEFEFLQTAHGIGVRWLNR